MKNFKIKYLLSFLMMASIFVNVLSSCTNDGSGSESSGVLAVESVSKAVGGDLTPTTVGFANNMYIIQGSGFTTVEKVFFNNTDTYFNPTMVTDKAIFVTIDLNTPYANASNELKIVTKNGTVVYPFTVAPPAPQFKSYNPINAVTGDVVTIYGSFFLNPVVTIGTTPIAVISSTLTEIKVKLPAGSDKKYIKVSTISGAVTSTDAIGTAIYDDVFYGIDGTGGWGISNLLIDNTAPAEVAQGTKAIKVDITSWSGFQIDMWANGGHPVPSGATGIKFKMKLKADARVRIIVGGDWGHQVWFDVKADYDNYVVKWSDLGLSTAPASVGQLVFGSDGTNTTFYIDNLGFQL